MSAQLVPLRSVLQWLCIPRRRELLVLLTCQQVVARCFVPLRVVALRSAWMTTQLPAVKFRKHWLGI